jgi:hypothetical protein
MAHRRFAECSGAALMSTRTISLVIAAGVSLASLGGCASPQLFAPAPGSVAEQLWFDKSTGADYDHTPPLARIQGLRGYPRSDARFYRAPPPDVIDGQ